MRLRKLTGWMTATALTVMSCTGFTVLKEGYETYQTAVEAESLDEKIAKIQAKRGYTKLSELPDTYAQAVVSVEDHRFYNHFGLDPIAIGRALVQAI